MLRPNSMSVSRFFLMSVGFSFTFCGCSILFGNVKPVTEKSTSYQIVDLSNEHDNYPMWASEWEKFPPRDNDIEKSDITFHSKNTNALISINTSCTKQPSEEVQVKKQKTLQELTRELLLGLDTSSPTLSPMEEVKEETKEVDRVPALQTTLKKVIEGKPLMIRTVVLQKKACVYDMMYIVPEKYFKTNERDFERFVASFKLNP